MLSPETIGTPANDFQRKIRWSKTMYRNSTVGSLPLGLSRRLLAQCFGISVRHACWLSAALRSSAASRLSARHAGRRYPGYRSGSKRSRSRQGDGDGHQHRYRRATVDADQQRRNLYATAAAGRTLQRRGRGQRLPAPVCRRTSPSTTPPCSVCHCSSRSAAKARPSPLPTLRRRSIPPTQRSAAPSRMSCTRRCRSP